MDVNEANSNHLYICGLVPNRKLDSCIRELIYSPLPKTGQHTEEHALFMTSFVILVFSVTLCGCLFVSNKADSYLEVTEGNISPCRRDQNCCFRFGIGNFSSEMVIIGARTSCSPDHSNLSRYCPSAATLHTNTSRCALNAQCPSLRCIPGIK